MTEPSQQAQVNSTSDDPAITSPLNEITDKDITLDELFHREPLSLTDEHLTRIVLSLRESRKQFNLSEATKAAKPRKAAKPEAEPELPGLAADVASLDL